MRKSHSHKKMGYTVLYMKRILKLPIFLQGTVLVIIMSMLMITPLAHAARCGVSNEEEIAEEYDQAVDEFTDQIRDNDIKQDIRNIRDAVDVLEESGRGRSSITSAIRTLKNKISDLEDESDNIYDGFKNQRKRSIFDDCENEIEDKADEIRTYFRDEVRELRGKVDDLKDRANDVEGDVRKEVRAPKFDLKDADKSVRKNKADKTNRTSSVVRAEIKLLIKKLQGLFIEFVTLKEIEEGQN